MSHWDEDIQLKDHIKELEDFIPKGFQALYRLQKLYGLELLKSYINEYDVNITLRYSPGEVDFIYIRLGQDQLCNPTKHRSLDSGAGTAKDATPLFRTKMRILRTIYLTYKKLQEKVTKYSPNGILGWKETTNNIEYSMTITDKQKYPNSSNTLYVRLADFSRF